MSNTFCLFKLLALLSAYKVYRSHSVLYKHDKMYKLAKVLKLSVNTLNKYVQWAEDLNLLIPAGKGHRKFISISKAFEILFPKVTYSQHIRWFKGFEKKIDIKYYYEKLKWAFARVNYKQQEYNIELTASYKKSVNSKLKKGFYNKILKKFGMSCEIELNKRISQSKKDVVTGKYHLSGILKCNPSTAGKLLSKWAKEKLFTRSIHNLFISEVVNNHALDFLKAKGYKNTVVEKTHCGFFLNLGSALTNIQ